MGQNGGQVNGGIRRGGALYKQKAGDGMDHAKRHDQPKARVKMKWVCEVVVYLVALKEERGAGGAQQAQRFSR